MNADQTEDKKQWPKTKDKDKGMHFIHKKLLFLIDEDENSWSRLKQIEAVIIVEADEADEA